MVRREFAVTRKEEHVHLVAALLKACRYCDAPANRAHVIEILSQKQYLDTPAESLRAGLAGEMDRGDGLCERSDDFTIFARNNANEPSEDKAAWILNSMGDTSLCEGPQALKRGLGHRVFSLEVFDEALRLCNSTQNDDENKLEIENEPTFG
jgi:hypothetical protein